MSKQEACFACATRVWLAAITTPASILANAIDVRSVLNGQVSLAAVKYMCVFYEVMKGFKNLKIH